jgi:hypothetical protein
MMGPISLDWYTKRGIDVVDGWPETIYYGGRIDVRGLPFDEYYNGGTEYGLGVMLGEDWSALSDWMRSYKTEELTPRDALLKDFEAWYGRRIRWYEQD